MKNARFATAVHILTLLADSPEEWLSSDWIAGSININPAMVRRELVALQQAGLVQGRKGKEGGARLSRAAKSITLADVYSAVNQSTVLGRKQTQPSVKCKIGKQINRQLENVYSATEHTVLKELQSTSLQEFANRF